MTRLTIIVIVVLITACRGANKPSNEGNPAQGQTNVVLKWDTLNYVLQSCSATLESEKLKLYIEQRPDSVSDYAIEITQIDKKLAVNVSQPWSVTDCSYVAPRFKILNQEIRLDKEKYRKNDNVKGELNILMLGHKDYFRDIGEMKLREDWDTVRCSGVFSSIVK